MTLWGMFAIAAGMFTFLFLVTCGTSYAVSRTSIREARRRFVLLTFVEDWNLLISIIESEQFGFSWHADSGAFQINAPGKPVDFLHPAGHLWHSIIGWYWWCKYYHWFTTHLSVDSLYDQKSGAWARKYPGLSRAAIEDGRPFPAIYRPGGFYGLAYRLTTRFF